MPVFKPSYSKNIKQYLRVKVLRRKGVALKRPIRSTFKARSYITKLPAFGQRSYSYSALRHAKKWLGLK